MCHNGLDYRLNDECRLGEVAGSFDCMGVSKPPTLRGFPTQFTSAKRNIAYELATMDGSGEFKELEALGVTAQNAESLEQVILQKAQEKIEKEEGGSEDAGYSVDDDSLAVITTEIEALEAALHSGEGTNNGNTELAAMAKDKPESSRGAAKRSLQRATMRARVVELKQKRDQLKGQIGGEGACSSVQLEKTATGLVETERDRLVRMGLLTPFDNLDGFERRIKKNGQSSLQMDLKTLMQEAAKLPAVGDSSDGEDWHSPSEDGMSDIEESGPLGFEKTITPSMGKEEHTTQNDDDSYESEEDGWPSLQELKEKFTNKVTEWRTARPRTKFADGKDLPARPERVQSMDPMFWRRAASGPTSRMGTHRQRKRLRKLCDINDELSTTPKIRKRRPERGARQSDRRPKSSKGKVGRGGGNSRQSDFEPSSAGGSGSGCSGGNGNEEDVPDNDRFDDANDDAYNARIEAVGPSFKERLEKGDGIDQDDFVEFDGGYRIPTDIYEKLFDYQKTSIKWLWELHMQKAGGIVGDEMGLGKTIQVTAFLGGLHSSGLFRPSLVVCPATVLRQWLKELRTWYPWFRVVILHDSARKGPGPKQSRQELVKKVSQSTNGILLTTYEHLRIYKEDLLDVDWDYVVLDEGHKIQNPDAEVTLAAKQVQTVHRIIASGSPIQNRLTELWSLFDFIFPGKLGTLPVFKTQFALPIQIGGYTNASQLQVSTAYKCAVVLRDLIAPYILHRRKSDVNVALPKKTEQVLFCSLTKEQREFYRAYIHSRDVQDIIDGKRQALAGIDILRKICNHPDLLERGKYDGVDDYGNPDRSGKLTVTMKVLKRWKEEGHKVLLFSQTQQMLDVIEKLAQEEGYNYHRMDGSTTVQMRARLMDDFNTNPDVFLFLLTTRVGGLGVNLTGANRILLYDPDWNPSTDVQARERAWRIGQKKDVTIYRLITSGTIEEKVYQRQVYKHFLTNKVLRDPQQKRFFTSKDIRDLFKLGDEKRESDTSRIFSAVHGEILPQDSPTGVGQPSAANGNGGNSGSSADRQTKLDEPGPSRGRKRDARSIDGGDASEGARKTSKTSESGSPNSDSSGHDGDSRILQELFEKGLRGAIDHSKIEAANDPEVLAVHEQARRIATQAAERLRESRILCQHSSIATPTWTGRSGEAGLPGRMPAFGVTVNPRLGGSAGEGTGGTNRRFGKGAAGMSGGATQRSSDILAKLRGRESIGFSVSQGEASSAGIRNEQMRMADRFASQVISFLSQKGGRCASAAIVGHFQRDVSGNHMVLFRHVLKQVADLVRRGERGEWVLKGEFRGNV